MENQIFSGRLAELLKIARHQSKKAFVDPAMIGGGGAPPMDPAMMGGGGGAPPMDPSMMGGAPPMDPSMMGGAPMDPSMMGGAPPMDPSMMGGAPPTDPLAGGGLEAMITSAVQAAMASVGGAGQGQPGPDGRIKPKIDVNVEIMQIKNMLAKIADGLGIHIPAQDMVATPEKLTGMAQGVPPTSADAGGSAIPPIAPMQGASPELAAGGASKMGAYRDGSAYADSHRMIGLSNRASAMAEVLAARSNDHA